MEAAILAIGDELVLGQTVDHNSPWLSGRLAEQGILTRAHWTVPDDAARIMQAVLDASGAAELVLVTGGLGPTADDLTRQALADAMGSPLVRDERSLAQIEAFFAARGKPVPERNKVQALRPEAATPLFNDAGTAPGIRAPLGGATVYVMPGVPREMRRMWEQTLAPALAAPETPGTDAAQGRGVIRTLTINTFGEGESDVADRIDDLMARDGNPTVGTTVSHGIVAIRLRAQYPTAAETDEALEAIAAEIERRLGPICFGRDEQTLQDAVITLLGEHGLTVATAESCTGGLVGVMLTDVPGSSDVYCGGWITYIYAMKQSELGVPEATLAEHGAVSEPTVRALASGALARSGADVAVSVSGVAGPGGGSNEKPVGTVWISLARGYGRSSRDALTEGDPLPGEDVTTEAMRFQLPGDRTAVRDRAARCALQMLRLHVMGESLTHIRWGSVVPRRV